MVLAFVIILWVRVFNTHIIHWLQGIPYCCIVSGSRLLNKQIVPNSVFCYCFWIEKFNNNNAFHNRKKNPSICHGLRLRQDVNAGKFWSKARQANRKHKAKSQASKVQTFNKQQCQRETGEKTRGQSRSQTTRETNRIINSLAEGSEHNNASQQLNENKWLKMCEAGGRDN